MKLIVGLGNPGPEYARTRHNVGYEVVDRLARRFGDSAASSPRARFSGLTVEAELGGQRVLLLKPTTFMNRSGRAVSEAIGFFKMNATSDLIVVADDLDLPCGTIRVRADGGAGGHNGLADILSALGTPEWNRCRIGIDKPESVPQADYVLGRFTPDQQPLAEEGIEEACKACEVWCRDGLATTMNQFNRKVISKVGDSPTNQS